MTTSISTGSLSGTVELAPSYRLALAIVVLAIPFLLIQPLVSLVMEVFGLFLMIQTATIRLTFTESALEVYRSGKLIRQFPYADWRNWEIFWSGVPILFYFREVKSIHFVPMLFDAAMLRQCLAQRCPKA